MRRGPPREVVDAISTNRARRRLCRQLASSHRLKAPRNYRQARLNGHHKMHVKLRVRADSDSATSPISTPTQRTIAKKDEPTEQSTSRSATSALPPANQPIAKIDLPPIGYDAASVTANAEPLSVAMLMLAKEVKVEPEWILHGTVAEPPRATISASIKTAQHASAEITPKQQSSKHTTKKSFWTKLHDLFAGSPEKTDCVGKGCS